MTDALVRVPLHRLAHARSGDKGNRLNLAVFAYDPAAWPWLDAELTEARVLAHFRHRGATAVRRYPLPRLHALNFVLDDALEGGVNAALNLDAHGKCSSSWLLGLTLAVPRDLPRR